GHLGQQRVGQGGLAAAGAAGHEDVLPLTYGHAQVLGLLGAKDAVGNVLLQWDDPGSTLAQGKGRPGHHWRQYTLEALASFWQLGAQQRLVAMYLLTDMRGHQADDPFTIGSR